MSELNVFDKNFLLLLHLAKNCGLDRSCRLSTLKLSNEFGGSQQTISRKLRELEEAGLIERFPYSSGMELVITSLAKKYLKTYLNQIQRLFDEPELIGSIVGKVRSGLGEGAYYVSLSQYMKQFREKLGFTPFSGTLNLEVNEVEFQKILLNLTPVKIDGFKTRKRTFGSINCYRVKIKNYNRAVLMIPKRSVHKGNVVELIAPDVLRDELNLEDGDELKIDF